MPNSIEIPPLYNWSPTDNDVIRYVLGFASPEEVSRFRIAILDPDLFEFVKGVRLRLDVFQPLVRGYRGVRLAARGRLRDEGRWELWERAREDNPGIVFYSATDSGREERMEQMWDRIVQLDKGLLTRRALYASLTGMTSRPLGLVKLVSIPTMAAFACFFAGFFLRSGPVSDQIVILNSHPKNAGPKVSPGDTNDVEGDLLQLSRTLNTKFKTPGTDPLSNWSFSESKIDALYTNKLASRDQVLVLEAYLAERYKAEVGAMPPLKIKQALENTKGQ